MFKQFFLRERNILIAIVLNAIVIFFLYFPSLEKNHPQIYQILDLIDHLFVLLFVAEAIVKINALKSKRYFKDGWNVFDFVIAIASIPSILAYVGIPFLPNTSVFKMLRLFRCIRIFRYLAFIPRMDMIFAGLKRAVNASVFVLLALTLLNFILSLFTCHFYGQLVPEYFGNPLTSSYYIFQMFTVEGWNEIPEAIEVALGNQGVEHFRLMVGFSRFYFILIVLVGGIFGMSLANAVFVDEMTLDNNQGLEKKIDDLQTQIADLKDLIKKGGNTN